MLKRSLPFALLLSLTAAAQAQKPPLVMETLGIKIGDTPAQIDKVLTGLGYKLVGKEDYVARLGMPARPQRREYQYLVLKPGALPNEKGYVKVGFGQKTSTVEAIARRERFDQPVSRAEMEKALIAKYGPVTKHGGQLGPLEWMSLESDRYKPNDSPDVCKVAVAGNVNYNRFANSYEMCRQTVAVMLTEFKNQGAEIQEIQVSMVDFVAHSREAAALEALVEKERKDEMEKRRQAPVPKI